MLYYCCANKINIGDYFSMQGVIQSVDRSGKVIFLELQKTPLKDFLNTLDEKDTIIIGGGRY